MAGYTGSAPRYGSRNCPPGRLITVCDTGVAGWIEYLLLSASLRLVKARWRGDPLLDFIADHVETGSAVVDLTNRAEDPLSQSSGFDPIRHRLGVQYEDDCLRLGATWRRYYNNTGDARRGNSFLLTLAFTNLGR